MSDRIDDMMTRLPEPKAPAALTATVMARIARLPEPADARARAVASPRPSRLWWLWNTAGVLMFAVPVLLRWWRLGSAPGLLSSRSGLGRMLWLPGAGPDALVIAVALCLFLAGLFGPLGRRQA